MVSNSTDPVSSYDFQLNWFSLELVCFISTDSDSGNSPEMKKFSVENCVPTQLIPSRAMVTNANNCVSSYDYQLNLTSFDFIYY